MSNIQTIKSPLEYIELGAAFPLSVSKYSTLVWLQTMARKLRLVEGRDYYCELNFSDGDLHTYLTVEAFGLCDAAKDMRNR